MHLAILSMGIGRLLSMFKVKKKIRVGLIAVFVFMYMAFTGFSISVVRAGIMLILSSVLYLLSRTKDSLTSLSVAATLICLLSPNAIFDVSLQLSVLATFGIIVLSEIYPNFKTPKTPTQKVLKYFATAILASVFAISATLYVSATTFGGFSVIAPIATIIFSLIAEIIMYLGCLLIIIGWLVPIGWLITPICAIMTWLSGILSSTQFAYVSTNFDLVLIVIAIYSIVFYLFTIVKLNKPLKALNFIVILFCIVTILPASLTIFESNNETVAYHSDSKSDQMLIRSENEVCLINSSQYDKNLAFTTLDFLDDAKVTYLDKYYLTHYSWSIDDEIDVLLGNISVGNIYLPDPVNDDERTILKIIYKATEKYRTNVVLFKQYETIKLGKYSINLLYSAPYGDTSMNAFAIAKGDEVFTYISSGLLETSKKEQFLKYFSLSDYIILGEHGKKYKDKIYIDDCFSDLKAMIIHSSNVFLTQDNMQFFLDNGCKIYSHPKEIVYLVKN